jgi:hypothetical protein
MRRVGFVMVAVLAAFGCKTDHECRDGTVLVTVSFVDPPALVDGLSLRYRLDEGPLVDLKPMIRPAGTAEGQFALEVKNYASRKQLLLQYAPRRGELIVGTWQERRFELQAGCSAVELTVAVADDGGASVDGAEPDVQATSVLDAGRLDAGRAETGVEPIDLARSTTDSDSDSQFNVADVPLQNDADQVPTDVRRVDAQPDLPLGPLADGPSDPVAVVDIVGDRAATPSLDGEQETRPEVTPDVPADAAADAGPDLSGVGCHIGVDYYEFGTANLTNLCQTCQPAVSPTSWSQAVDGTGCGAGQVCQRGLCRPGCWIDGTFQQSAATKPGNNCQFCNPNLSVSAWTLEDDGKSCGNSEGCKAGLCGSGCWINGVFYASGATQPGNPCQSCQPGTSVSVWTVLPERTPCNGVQLCSAGSCGDCIAGDTKCKDSNVQQQCLATRAWADVTCNYGCNATSRTCNLTRDTPMRFGRPAAAVRQHGWHMDRSLCVRGWYPMRRGR